MMQRLFDLPADNPFTPAVIALLWFAFVKLAMMTLISICMLRLVRWLIRRERQYDRTLALAEANAQLGKERREDAKAIVLGALEEKKNELVEKIPPATAKAVAEIAPHLSGDGNASPGSSPADSSTRLRGAARRTEGGTGEGWADRGTGPQGPGGD